MNLSQLVVVRAEVQPKKQERARRKCLERLLFELRTWETTHVWIESRQGAQNRRGLELVDALRIQKTLPPTLRIEFAKPLDDSIEVISI